MPLRRSRAFRRDLLDVWIYVAQGGNAAADQAIDRIAAAESKLADYPELGSARDGFGSDIRVLPVSGHLLFYRICPDYVEVLRAIDGRRHITAAELDL